MTTIPERIREEARKAIYDTGRGMIGRERNYLEDRVCRALLAEYERGREEERERCAEIAESIERAARILRLAKAQSQPDHCGYHLHEEQTAKTIAAAIRSTN